MKAKTKAWMGGVVAVVTLIGTAVSTAHDDPPIVLDGTEVIEDLCGAAGSETFFQIEVPCGMAELVIRTTGGTGDCALFASRDVLPTISDYEYCDGVDGNLEIIVVTQPKPGTYFILLYGDVAYSGVKLWARANEVVSLSLANGIPVMDIRGAGGSKTYYRIEVPEGQDYLEINTWGGAGGADLYVRREGKPTSFNCDARSATGGADEFVHIDCPEPGTWYILLYGDSDYEGVNLVTVYGISDAAFMLRDEAPIGGLSDSAGGREWYAIDVPAGQAGIAFRIYGGTGDCDMYIKRGTRPTESDWGYRPTDSGNNESISIGNPAGGRWYVLLKADSSYSGVTLEADYWAPVVDDVIPLASGLAVTGIAGAAGDELFFTIEAPVGVKTLEIKMSGGSGDADLYVRKGSLPTVAEYDFRPYLAGNEESVAVDNPSHGVWCIMIRGYQAFSGVTLVATCDTDASDAAASLANGETVSGLAGRTDSETFFVIDVPERQAQLRISTSGGTGDVDLYVCLGHKPTMDEWDYRPYLAGNNETVIVSSPKAGKYYVLLRGYMAYAGVTLQAGFSEAKP